MKEPNLQPQEVSSNSLPKNQTLDAIDDDLFGNLNSNNTVVTTNEKDNNVNEQNTKNTSNVEFVDDFSFINNNANQAVSTSNNAINNTIAEKTVIKDEEVKDNTVQQSKPTTPRKTSLVGTKRNIFK